MKSEVTVPEIQPLTDSAEDRQWRMPNTTSETSGSIVAIRLWLCANPPKKRGSGRPKKPEPTLWTGLRIPKANGRPRHPVKPPGKCGAPKKYDAATMWTFIERIDRRKSKARAEGRSISDDRAVRDNIIQHYQLEKRVATKLALGLPKRNTPALDHGGRGCSGAHVPIM